MSKYIGAYGKHAFAVNFRYSSKAIQQAKSALHTLALLKMGYYSLQFPLTAI